jgi:hypothetical protein
VDVNLVRAVDLLSLPLTKRRSTNQLAACFISQTLQLVLKGFACARDMIGKFKMRSRPLPIFALILDTDVKFAWEGVG